MDMDEEGDESENGSDGDEKEDCAFPNANATLSAATLPGQPGSGAAAADAMQRRRRRSSWLDSERVELPSQTWDQRVVNDIGLSVTHCAMMMMMMARTDTC